MKSSNRINYHKQLIELLGTYHVMFESSPLEAFHLPLIFVKDLLEWKSNYLKTVNEKLEEQIQNTKI